MHAAVSQFEQSAIRSSRAARIRFLLQDLENVVNETDPVLADLCRVVAATGVQVVLVGGIAVIAHGYERTTSDRDLLVSREHAERLVETLGATPTWERVESSEFAVLHVATGCPVEFVVAGELASLGLIPYYLPRLDEIQTAGTLAGLPLISLTDLVYLKMIAGRMRDHADVMELCKLHPDSIQFDAVLARFAADDMQRRDKLAEIRRLAPQERDAELRRKSLLQESSFQKPPFQESSRPAPTDASDKPNHS